MQAAGLLPQHGCVWLCLVLILQGEVRACLAHDGGGVKPSTGLQAASKWTDPFPGIAGAARPLLRETHFLGLSLGVDDRRWTPRRLWDQERALAAACRGQAPAGCCQRLMRGLLASVTGVDVPAAPTPFYGASGLEGADAVPAGWPGETAHFCPASLLGSRAPRPSGWGGRGSLGARPRALESTARGQGPHPCQELS